MPRRKIAMRLIENARARATTYAKRTKGLQKKASELSTLCAVPVAFVYAGTGAQLVWESEEGVLDRYRGAAVQPEARARRHTHRSYLEAELGKERAKLARARPAALADWHPALDDMTVDEAREVLETIDAALRAAGDRMVALGLPAVDEQVALAPDDDASDNTGGVPQQLELEDMEYAGFQMQMVPCHDGNNDGSDLLEQCLWDDDRFPTQPGYGGLESVGGNYDVGAFDETQAAAGYCSNADCSWPDLTTVSYANDGSRATVLPADYYYYPKFVDGTLAPEHYSAQVVAGEDYIDTLPLQYPIDNSCTAPWQAEEFQPSDTNSSMMDESYTESFLMHGGSSWDMRACFLVS